MSGASAVMEERFGPSRPEAVDPRDMVSPPLPVAPVSVHWVRADAETGEIHSWGRCRECDAPPDAILGEASPDTHRVKDGTLVEYTEEQRAARAVRPSPWHAWSNADMAWADPRPRAEQRAAAAAGIRMQRDALIAATDWTQLKDAPKADTAVTAYRQALRDITKQPGFPDAIDWPVAPV